MNNLKLITSLIIILAVAVAVWYAPVVFKGYNESTTASHALVRAKNLALVDRYASEDKLNIILSPNRVRDEAQESLYGNKLGTILYAKMIKIFALKDNNQVVLVNCLILALALIFFCLAVYYLFDLKIMIVFSLIYIFLPSNWNLPQMLVGYEFAILFLSLFILFLTLGSKGLSTPPKTAMQKISTGLSGVFLVLACLSREAFFLILPILFVYLLVTKSLRKIVYYVFIPAILIWAIVWLPDFFRAKNTYLLFFDDQVGENLKSADFSYYAHLFPDPYTYYFGQEEYLKNKYNLEGLDTMTRLGREKVLTNMGFGSVNLWQRIKLGSSLLLRHIFRFFSITEIGGPLIFLLFFLGLILLKHQKKYWFTLCLAWMGGSVCLLAYANLAGRNHMMDFGWMIALLTALGFLQLADLLTKNVKLQILFLVLVIYNLVLTGHVMWGQMYDNSSVPRVLSYVAAVDKSGIDRDKLVATPLSPNDAYSLNFSTDQTVVVFANETVEELIQQNKLKEAFDKFQVKYVLGYSPEITAKILEQTEVENIADSSLPIRQEDIKMNNKNWFLNLVK